MAKSNSGKKGAPNRKRNAYVRQPSSVCVSAWSQDGAPVSDAVLNELADSIAYIAKNHNLLISAVRA